MKVTLEVELTLESFGLGEEFSSKTTLENVVNNILSHTDSRETFHNFGTSCHYDGESETLVISTTLEAMPTEDEIRGLVKRVGDKLGELVKFPFSVLDKDNHDLEGFANLHDAIHHMTENEEAYAVSYRGETLFNIDENIRNVFAHTTAMMYYSYNEFNEDECIRLFGARLGNHIWNKFDGDFLKLLGNLDDKCRTTINYAVIAYMNKTNR